MAPDTLSLAGKVAIITGSGRENGIGAGIARTLARNGAAVTINYVSQNSAARAERTAQEIRDLGARVTVVEGSIETQEGAAKIVTETLKAFGAKHIDILVNNAGVGSESPLLSLAPEQLQSEFSVNVFGTLYMTQAVVNVGNMPRGGRIFNIGSVASKMGSAGVGVYAATKAATESFTATWAWELGRQHGITINTIAPGPVATDRISDGLKSGTDPAAMESLYITPFVEMTRAEGRIGTVDDIADAILLLSSEKSRWITAQYIGVNGGITIM